MTDTTGYEKQNNISTPPEFAAEYINGNRESTITLPEGTTALQPVVAFDEGGNFIRLRFGPLTQARIDNGQLYGNYHIQSTSAAVDAGVNVGITDDFDRELRPSGAAVDIGADEVQQVQLLFVETKKKSDRKRRSLRERKKIKAEKRMKAKKRAKATKRARRKGRSDIL